MGRQKKCFVTTTVAALFGPPDGWFHLGVAMGGYRCSRLVPVLERGISLQRPTSFPYSDFQEPELPFSPLGGVLPLIADIGYECWRKEQRKKEKKQIYAAFPAGYGSNPSHFVESEVVRNRRTSSAEYDNADGLYDFENKVIAHVVRECLGGRRPESSHSQN